MPKQLELKLFTEEQNENLEWTMAVDSHVFWVKFSVDDVLDTVINCPNCEVEYLPNNGCNNCWYWLENNQNYEDLEEKQELDKKKAKYIKLWTIKFNTSSNIRANNFYIPENREFVVDINNSIIGTNEAILYVKIKNFKCKIVCNYETINQFDENHRIDEELWKVTHNVRIVKVIELKWGQEIEFNFKVDILKAIKDLLKTKFLNNFKYNKNL